MTYDPAYMNTASCRSSITYIDGDKGILEYRGYPIEQAGREVELPRGRLPADPRQPPGAEAARRLGSPDHDAHVRATRTSKEFMQGFRYDAHPMGMLMASVGALSTFYPEAAQIKDHELRQMQVVRLNREDADARGLLLPAQQGHALRVPGQRPQLRRQLPLDDLQDRGAQVPADPRLERALDVLFILHADHEQNCSTSGGAQRRLLAGRPLLGRGRRHRRAVRAAARRRQRGGAADAAPDRHAGQHPRLHSRASRRATSA